METDEEGGGSEKVIPFQLQFEKPLPFQAKQVRLASEGSRALEPDRLSSLPDDILCHILSFLPTTQSVRTRILSSRWKYLFASVPILDFCYYSTYKDESKRNKFIEFVNFVWISYNVSHMEKFHLSFRADYRQPPYRCPIASWLCAAIRRHVKEIILFISNSSETMALPRDLFSSKTLSVLELYGRFNISLPDTVFLPCLKTCALDDVSLSDELSKRLFRSLPALETLQLTQCYIEGDVEVLNISSSNLKRLKIWECYDDCEIELSVPNLISFEYCALATNDPESRDANFMDLLRGICHVRELTISCELIEAFVRSGKSLPKFNNLTRLTLGPISSLASKLLEDLLENTPRLESFSFNEWPADEHEDGYSLPQRVPDCVSQHLTEVRCLFFTGLGYDRELLKYFWKNAKNLKNTKIRSSFTYNETGMICGPAYQILSDSDDEL